MLHKNGLGEKLQTCHAIIDPVYMSQSVTTEKFVQQTSAKNPITGPVYMSKAPALNGIFR